MTKLYTITILFFLFFSKIILAVSWSDFTDPACSFFKENTMMCVTAGTSAVAAFTSYRWLANNRYAAVLTREIEIKNKAIKEKNKEIETKNKEIEKQNNNIDKLIRLEKLKRFKNMSREDKIFLSNLADDALEKITPTLTKATESCSKQMAYVAATQKNMEGMIKQHTERMKKNEESSHESYLKNIKEDTLQTKNNTKQILENQKYLTNGIYALKKTAASIENKSGIMLAAIELFKSRLITPNYRSTPTKKPLALEG